VNKFAPVLIATLNRHVHFKRCVESLAACTHADETILYIAFDYPLNESHKEGYEIIRAYLPNIKGFKTVNIIEREKNFGVRNNFVDARKEIFKNYDRMILSEDDNVFAPSFLMLVNKGLKVYEKRQDIFSIAGYNSPFPMPVWYKHDVYLRTGFTGWGVGIWREKWHQIDWSIDNFNAMYKKKGNLKEIKKNYQRYIGTIDKIRDTKKILGDGFIFLHMLDKGMFSVYPVKTRVRNTGHDGTGVNCGNNGTIYLNQTVYEGREDPCLPYDLELDENLTKYVLKQIQLSFSEKLKGRIPPAIRVFLKKYLKNK
jgi:hypothetical protein